MAKFSGCSLARWSVYVLNDHQAMSTSRFTGTDSQGGKHEAQMVDLFVFEGDKISVKNAFRKNRPAISGD